ncbi:helix-turn-helix transcriptional regulator [Streptomyces sp. NPDC006385]|uniref:helix-turn-helix domain-containing protein n=1 Tax=Streptomyces sp. NPDC006385 TaxID=3156761 RepID=UPI0033A6EFB6
MPDDQPEWIRLACQQQGSRVCQAREHASLTQEKLAERTELGRSTIQRIEAGEGIEYAHLVAIAHALDVEVPDLVQ